MKTIQLILLSSVLALTSLWAGEVKLVFQPNASAGYDKWFGTFYNRQGVNDGYLVGGGWGDYHYTLIRFKDLEKKQTGFKRAELWFYGTGIERPVDMNAWTIVSPWTETAEDHWNLQGIYLGVYPGPPVGNGWYGLNVTWSVRYIQQNKTKNYGWLFGPTSVDNRFNYFYSSDTSTASLRPKVHLVYDVPDFKLPLPGGKYWKLTVEAGGRSSDGELDQFHTGRTYYSLDFAPQTITGAGAPVINEGVVPILAMADGRVNVVGNVRTHPNGFHVKIDHDGDSDNKTGFQSVYAHFENIPSVSLGQIVRRGQVLGYMGNTGISHGKHIHFTIYYQDTALGDGADPLLNLVKIEGQLIKNFDLNTPVDRPVFYRSTNIPIF